MVYPATGGDPGPTAPVGVLPHAAAVPEQFMRGCGGSTRVDVRVELPLAGSLRRHQDGSRWALLASRSEAGGGGGHSNQEHGGRDT